jgi:hypothetical protein
MMMHKPLFCAAYGTLTSKDGNSRYSAADQQLMKNQTGLLFPHKMNECFSEIPATTK